MVEVNVRVEQQGDELWFGRDELRHGEGGSTADDT